eukprot:1364933-Amphidinium_carterae.1
MHVHRCSSLTSLGTVGRWAEKRTCSSIFHMRYLTCNFISSPPACTVGGQNPNKLNATLVSWFGTLPFQLTFAACKRGENPRH